MQQVCKGTDSSEVSGWPRNSFPGELGLFLFSLFDTYSQHKRGKKLPGNNMSPNTLRGFASFSFLSNQIFGQTATWKLKHFLFSVNGLLWSKLKSAHSLTYYWCVPGGSWSSIAWIVWFTILFLRNQWKFWRKHRISGSFGGNSEIMHLIFFWNLGIFLQYP